MVLKGTFHPVKESQKKIKVLKFQIQLNFYQSKFHIMQVVESLKLF